jgi:hypothetical protein
MKAPYLAFNKAKGMIIKMKIIAFHLPQYHIIPENDKWWGKGFTEWTNVKRGKRYFRGHYQPREPLNDNYYDLSEDKTLVDQMKLAKKYGVYGFCFYHYYFSGKKLLEKPLERLLENKNANLPFCLAWANQSWERTWYRSGENKTMLQMQVYGGEKEWADHFSYLLKFFMDERYIKIDNKPVFLIYLPQDIKKRKKMFETWDKLAVINGFSGMYLIAMNTSYGRNRAIGGVSATVEFEPMITLRERVMFKKDILNINNAVLNKLKVLDKPIIKKFFLNIASYDRINQYIIKRKYKTKEKIFLGAFPGWDNTARKDEDGIILKGSTPKKFEKYLGQQIKKSEEMGNEFLFINAWNEWSEGAYLEPDKKYGYSYLDAIRQYSRGWKND